jgi:hypothetical protein
MISLKEILNDIEKNMEKEYAPDLVPLDDWRLLETDHFSDMGFKPHGDFAMSMENPSMLVYRKKDGWYLKDGKKNKHFRFAKFEALTDYFDKYQQDLKKI